MAWIVFGTFFLIDGHAAWYWFVLWGAGCVYDLMREAYAEANKDDKCDCN